MGERSEKRTGEATGLAGIYAHPTGNGGAIVMAYCVCGARFPAACESAARAAHKEHVENGHQGSTDG